METMREFMGFGQSIGPTSEFTDADDSSVSGFLRVVDDQSFGERDPRTPRVFRDVIPDGASMTPEQYGERRRERSALRKKAISQYLEGVTQLDRKVAREPRKRALPTRAAR